MTADKERLGRCSVTSAGVRKWISVIVVAAVFYLSIFVSDEIAGYVLDGMRLAVTRVIPTALPFMLVSDVFRAMVSTVGIPLIGGLGKILGLPEISVAALIPGNVCGFPLGGKLTSEMYRDGVMEREVAERLLAYSSSPSPSFVLAVVGGEMLGEPRLGIMLLVCIYLSTVISAQLFRTKYRKNNIPHDNTRQSYNFVSSVKASAMSCVALTGFISIFSIPVGFIKSRLTLAPVSALMIALTEVTSACDYFANKASLPYVLSLTMIGFSLGFGGLSVFFQTASFAREHGLRMRKFLEIKLVCGLVCAALTAIGYRLLFT